MTLTTLLCVHHGQKTTAVYHKSASGPNFSKVFQKQGDSRRLSLQHARASKEVVKHFKMYVRLVW